MYKLLPPDAVNKAKREYSLRRVSVALLLLSTLFVIVGTATAPSLIFALEKRGANLFLLESVKKQGRVVDTSLEDWVEKTKSKLTATSPDENPDQPYTYFQKVLESKVVGISLTNFTWSKVANSNKTIKIVGVAKTRQSLLNFQSSLSNSGNWIQADFPVGAIAKESDIPFEITLTPQKPK